MAELWRVVEYDYGETKLDLLFDNEDAANTFARRWNDTRGNYADVIPVTPLSEAPALVYIYRYTTVIYHVPLPVRPWNTLYFQLEKRKMWSYEEPWPREIKDGPHHRVEVNHLSYNMQMHPYQTLTTEGLDEPATRAAHETKYVELKKELTEFYATPYV